MAKWIAVARQCSKRGNNSGE